MPEVEVTMYKNHGRLLTKNLESIKKMLCKFGKNSINE